VTGHRADSVTALLGADHHELDRLLSEAKRRLAAGEIARAAEVFSDFREGLERHIAAEEDLLFPALESRTGSPASGPLVVMRSEHADLRRLLAEVALALGSAAHECHVTPLAALTARIYAHNGKEERILYPMADRMLEGEPDRMELVRRIAVAVGAGDDGRNVSSDPSEEAD
jgi:iron-sulfur cluster repair protein YtfE (RIC family)